LEHNQKGQVVFIDPSMSALRDGPNKAHGGTGNWDTPEQVQKRIIQAGINPNRIIHRKLTNKQFFTSRNVGRFELILIDGAHDYKNVFYDLKESVKHLTANGYIFLHDSTHFLNRTGHMGVATLIEQVRKAGVEMVTFPGVAGLTLLRVTKPLNLLPINTLPPSSVMSWGLAAVGIGGLLGYWWAGQKNKK